MKKNGVMCELFTRRPGLEWKGKRGKLCTFPSPFPPPRSLIAGERSIAVDLHAGVATSTTIRASAFASRSYVFVLPPDVSDPVFLEAAVPGAAPLRHRPDHRQGGREKGI